MIRKIAVATVVLAVVLGLVAWVLVSAFPLRWPEAKIQTWLEQQTPIGTPYDAVLTYAKKKEWYPPLGQPSNADTGARFIHGLLGTYRGLPWRIYVEVIWAFDSDKRLQRIKVSKTGDTL